jgi:hypothetical protein
MIAIAVMVSCGGGSHDRLRGAAVTVVVVVDTSSSLRSRKKGFSVQFVLLFCCVVVLLCSLIQRSRTKDLNTNEEDILERLRKRIAIGSAQLQQQ